MKDCDDKCERVVNPEAFLKSKAETGVLTKDEKDELYELTGHGFLV